MTNSLRVLITSKLKTLCNTVCFETADKNSMYPHIVYSFSNIDLGDLNRRDYILNLDIWDKRPNEKVIEDLCDNIQTLFNGISYPQGDILPTFFLISRNSIADEDKNILHRVIRILIQTYKR